MADVIEIDGVNKVKKDTEQIIKDIAGVKTDVGAVRTDVAEVKGDTQSIIKSIDDSKNGMSEIGNNVFYKQIYNNQSNVEVNLLTLTGKGSIHYFKTDSFKAIDSYYVIIVDDKVMKFTKKYSASGSSSIHYAAKSKMLLSETNDLYFIHPRKVTSDIVPQKISVPLSGSHSLIMNLFDNYNYLWQPPSEDISMNIEEVPVGSYDIILLSKEPIKFEKSLVVRALTKESGDSVGFNIMYDLLE